MAGGDTYGGSLNASYLPTSHIASELEQPTDAKSLMAPFAGNPQQMYEFLMHPDNQEQMAHFGVHFNPQTIQQSPFFSNHFMQQHQQLGSRLSGAMSNVAMTPEAPMVSGAGSGISRAMQGMMGGPELQRQYQMKQLMAPMQQMGANIPPREFQRKQQLMDTWQGMLENLEKERTQGNIDKKQYDDAVLQLKQQLQDEQQDKYDPSKVMQGPYGMISPQQKTTQNIPSQPSQTPSSMPGQLGSSTQQTPQMPSPMVPGGKVSQFNVTPGSQPLGGNYQFTPWSGVGEGGKPPGYYPGKPASGAGGAQGAGGVQGRQFSAGKAYQGKLANYEQWISKVQGNLVPASGQEGSNSAPPIYWKDMDEGQRNAFLQQQQQLKQQFENEYSGNYESAGGGPKPGGAYDYSKNQPQKPPVAPGPMPGGQQAKPPISNFNQPPADMMNPSYGGQQQQQGPVGPPTMPFVWDETSGSAVPNPAYQQ